MAGLVPAISLRRARAPLSGMRGSSPRMTAESSVMVEIFGDAGRHARSTVGVSSLPLDPAVEVEAMFEVA